MCGIAGKIYFGSGEILSSDLKKMSSEIAHRGPDDEGFYISADRKVGLANRRLAIIDLSYKGHQPMSYLSLKSGLKRAKRYWITFNGEIYNFQSERKTLERLGYQFKSNSDTEVILALYDRHKENFLTHLRGMFAFAIYDEEAEIILLARDRLGVKPLKYFWDGKVFIFASELKAILEQKEVKRLVDWIAVHHYLTYGYVPAPKTGFEKIYKLKPGHYLKIDLKRKSLEDKIYWKPDFSEKLYLSEDQWCKEILSTLSEATKLRMIADVPVGAFLSGGVDSSSVVATMAQFSKEPIKTFTIGFNDEKSDERRYAEKIAKLYHTQHETLIAQPENVEELLPKLTYFYEEPFADSSAIITYMICKLAKKFVTVVLTGDGGDENFGGYDNRMKRLVRDTYFDYFAPFARLLGIPITSLLSRRGIPLAKRINKFLEKSKIPLADRYVTYNLYFLNEEKQSLYKDSFKKLTKDLNSYEIAREKFKESNALDKKDQALFFDLTSYLPDSQLTKVDIASMSASLEARSPYLDYKMVELAAKIPFNLKVSGGEYKYILKKALEKIVPKENLYRKKMGFSVPLSKWFTGNLKNYTKSLLLSKKAMIKELFYEDQIKLMFEKHSIKDDFGSKIWSILTLELWLKNYFG